MATGRIRPGNAAWRIIIISWPACTELRPCPSVRIDGLHVVGFCASPSHIDIVYIVCADIQEMIWNRKIHKQIAHKFRIYYTSRIRLKKHWIRIHTSENVGKQTELNGGKRWVARVCCVCACVCARASVPVIYGNGGNLSTHQVRRVIKVRHKCDKTQLTMLANITTITRNNYNNNNHNHDEQKIMAQTTPTNGSWCCAHKRRCCWNLYRNIITLLLTYRVFVYHRNYRLS